MTSPAPRFDDQPLLVELLANDRVTKASPPGGAEFSTEVNHVHLQSALYEPLRDFLSRPGKEFRYRLVELCWDLAGGQGPVPEALGGIVEALHAGSLIVDDIQDESCSRRGRPALHVTYGVPVALNAGNWLYFWAYSLLEKLELGPHVELSLYRWLSRTLARCHEGQALDLTLRMSRLPQQDVPALVETTTRLKTGALMGLAAVIPAVASGAPHQIATAFQRFGESLGVGLQMLDDLGGLVSERRCHKGHEDLVFGRPTWPWAWLARDLSEMQYLRLQQKCREVEERDLHPELLARELRQSLGKAGKRRVWKHLVQALRSLPPDLPGAHRVPLLQRELVTLMGSYD